MPKCRSCNDKDLELLTRWERVRNWCFLKVNDILFGEDMRDLTSHKYTHGFGEGYKIGVELERARKKHFQQSLDDIGDYLDASVTQDAA